VLSILINFGFGLVIAKVDKKSLILFFGIFFNLLLLAYYKYAFFIINDILGMGDLVNKSLLPIGISFFTFTQIAYLADIFSKKSKNEDFFNYLLFVCYFPHLIAGPLVYHKDLIGQFHNDDISKFKWEKINIGLIIFIIGLAKKVLVADKLSEFSDSYFSTLNPNILPHGFDSIVATLSYTLQLYFDFSGYSDMAIGLSLCFGIVLPFNFDSPFKATSIISFWQRWHISLTKFVGAYIYNPIILSVMRRVESAPDFIVLLTTLILPTLLVFLIIGLWHGAGFTFILFGLFHGLMIVINHLWRKYKKYFPSLAISKKIKNIFYWLLTFIGVNLAFVIFRAPSYRDALLVYKSILFNYSLENLLDLIKCNPLALCMIIFSMTLALSFDNLNKWRDASLEKSKIFNNIFFPLMLGILFFVVLVNLTNSTKFLYFNF
jgi:D-alanyl-lipoteichoic acid acyltransferase DltB (MBOAT superfamily)